MKGFAYNKKRKRIFQAKKIAFEEAKGSMYYIKKPRTFM